MTAIVLAMRMHAAPHFAPFIRATCVLKEKGRSQEERPLIIILAAAVTLRLCRASR
jgi:hypothetical protein